MIWNSNKLDAVEFAEMNPNEKDAKKFQVEPPSGIRVTVVMA